MAKNVCHWTPLAYLAQPRKEKDIALLILNRPLRGKEKKLKTLWKMACVTICVDGGANELYNFSKDDKSDEWVPYYITGDFDSIKENVMDYYAQKGVKIVSTPDQDHTDFTKAIYHLVSSGHDKEVSAIFVLEEFSGLLDQIFANINTLFEAAKITNKPVILLSSDSLAFLLQPGKHNIDVNSGLEGKKCGLLPVGSKCDRVTTTGLKWNLTNDALEFGNLVSTSNAFDGGNPVYIETSHPLLWTMEIL